MSGFNQTIVDTLASTRGLGHRNKATLQEMFPTSPIHDETLTDDTVRTMAQKLLLGDDDGSVSSGDGISEADAYYGFNPPFSRNFTGGGDDSVPSIPSGVDVGGEGLPGTAYLPNTASPGEGNGVDSTKVPDISSDMELLPQNNSFPASGGGALSNPASTSAAIAAQNDGATTIGAYIMGEAYPEG